MDGKHKNKNKWGSHFRPLALRVLSWSQIQEWGEFPFPASDLPPSLLSLACLITISRAMHVTCPLVTLTTPDLGRI